MNRITEILIIIFFICCARNVNAQTTNYQVHALFVLNIAKYSTWPGSSDELLISVYGKSRIYEHLIKNLDGKVINGMIAKVVQVEDIAQVANSHLVFLSEGKSGSLPELLKATEGKAVMIIAEREGLFKKGAGFSFVLMDNNTLRYDINNAELEKRQIKISKNLSSLAHEIM